MKGLRANEDGSVLIIVVVVVIVIAAMASGFLYMAGSDAAEGTSATQHMQRLYIAQAGISAGMAEMRSNQDYDSNGLGNTSAGFAAGTYTVTAAVNSGILTLTSVGEDAFGKERALEVIAERAIVPLKSNMFAAVTSMAPVETTGSIIIDGRDHDMNGNLVGGGVMGILSGGAITTGGNSSVGGNGVAPIKNGTEADNIFDADFDFSTVYPTGYPDTADMLFEVPAGTVKGAAQAAGTCFSSEADYNNFLAANGGSLPGGAIIYCDFDEALPFHIGDVINHPPSILILHNAAGNANAKNIHGKFKGMLICDSITHVNAQTLIIGAVHTAWPSAVGNAFGNGNSDILFSSEALANLPGVVSGPGGWNVVSWREISPP